MNIQQMIPRSSFCLLAWYALAVAPTFAQTITHVPLYRFQGSKFDSFGESVSGAGDVNGDGFADVIVGAPSDSNNGSFSGSARVLSGSDGSVLYNFEGSNSGGLDGDSLGYSVSGAGDVNGDGFADMIVGARFADANINRLNSGSARVFSGSDGSVLYNFDGNSAFDVLGTSVSGAGDVNGDGIDDFIVGAFGDDNNGGNSGSARVLSGSDGSVLYNFNGDSANDRFGWSVSGAGDVNGDGFADMIVGATQDDNGGEDSGSARVLSGIDGSVLYTFNGDSADDQFGWSVSGAGDVNGDGKADLIVGTPFDNNNNGGSARVLSGNDGNVLYNFDGGDSEADRFGISVSGAGDVNGDGFADVIVGAPLDDSDNGINSGVARVYSGSDGNVLYIFNGDTANDSFGMSVSGAGDINGDGIDDFVVGSPNGGNDGGSYVRVFVSQVSVLLGDCDQNGAVDFLDINPFIAILSSNSFLAQADCNQDGIVDFLDISAFIEILAGN